MANEAVTIQLNGIQHFAFCRRQWALITIEQLWKENEHTAEGQIFHRRADDEGITELRGDVLTVHGSFIIKLPYLAVSPLRGASGLKYHVQALHRRARGLALARGEWIEINSCL